MLKNSIACLFLCVVSLRAAAITGQQADEAIAKAKAFLLSQQNGGHWEPNAHPVEGGPFEPKAGQFGGLTSLATYALLASGEDIQKNPKVAESVKWLKDAPVSGIYAMGMRMQVWLLAPRTPEYRELMKKDATLVLQSVKLQGEMKGFYNYLVLDKEDRYDHSVSQYAVLGMWAAQQRGAEVPTAYWKILEEAWRRDQGGDGGWSYEGKNPGTPAMTAAGIASLFIFQDMIHGPEAIKCDGNIKDAYIDKGLDWITKHIKEIHNDNPFYTLYGIERIGVASGYKYFGTVDWYQEGADWLIGTQQANGSFGGGGHDEAIYNTAFGILFLTRGRAPVMMNKLQYTIDFFGDKGKDTHWNNRPRDAANIAHWMSGQLERYINWQIVNTQTDPDDWHDAPILYIAGNQPFALKPDDAAKIKRFIEQGGLVLANTDCSQGAFGSTFEKFGEKLFPGLKFRDIPADHLLLTQPYSAKNWKTRPSFRGLSNGARELMLVFPTGDPAKLWQIQSHLGTSQSSSEIMANIFLYTANKTELRNKEESYIVKTDPNVKADRTIKVARLLYGGKDVVPDPEPGGWRRLAAISHNQFRIDLDVVPMTLGEGKLTGDFKVAHFTGTRKFELSGKAIDELKKWVNEGGTLIVDAAGGSNEFADAAQGQIGNLFPPAKPPFAIIPADHALFKAAGDLQAVEYRPFARKTLGNLMTPRIRAMEINNRQAVYFSNEDLSVGLVGNSVDGVFGYKPASAVQLMLSMIYKPGVK